MVKKKKTLIRSFGGLDAMELLRSAGAEDLESDDEVWEWRESVPTGCPLFPEVAVFPFYNTQG